MASEREKTACAEELLAGVGVEVGHCRQVARLAVALFDQTASLHGLDRKARTLLACAGLLHDIGVSVTYQRHHKHSRDLILAASLPALTPREKLIVANLARYHRKGHPSPEHAHFARLAAADRELVRMLAALLRIADGLDRTHNDAVTAVEASETAPGHWRITVEGRGALSEELWAAREKKAGLFEEVFGVGAAIQTADSRLQTSD